MSPEVAQYLARFKPELLAVTEGRQVLTRLHPMLFALVYLREHVTDDNGHISFSEVHQDWCGQALEWIKPNKPREWRRAYIAPRSMGKSTWWFLILPLWAAAHGHKQFAIAFADSGAQATQHLATFKRELENNALLRRDFPDLCRPARRPNGVTEADARDMYRSKSGFSFIAKGVDSASLGAKQGSVRPDLLIFDDVEGAPGTYSVGQAASRLSTITEGLFPLNELASVVMVGTTTLPGGIMHQLVRSVTSNEKPEAWITDEKVVTHYYDPLPLNDDGTRRSVWPEKWPLEFLESIEHTRSFALNYKNDPMAADSMYWTSEDFVYGDVPATTRTMLSIDPAVTTKKASDYTGIAVVAFSPGEHKCVVRHVEAVKMTGNDIRKRALQLIQIYPEIGMIYIESNQGGDLWEEILHDMPVKVKTVSQSASKEVRAAQALNHYQRRKVQHIRQLVQAEAQMVAFPNSANDDMVDAIGTAVNYFLADQGPPKKAGAKQVSYV